MTYETAERFGRKVASSVLADICTTQNIDARSNAYHKLLKLSDRIADDVTNTIRIALRDNTETK